MPRYVVALLLSQLLPQVSLPANAQAPSREAVDFFETRVRPRLAESCYRCHGPEKQLSGLRLDSREGVLTGGSGEGPAVVPGKVDESPLIAAIRHEHDTLKMPPKAKLPDEAIQDL